LRRFQPTWAARLVKPIQFFSEAVGAITLAFIVVVQFPVLRSIGWKPVLVMALASELSFILGYALSGPAAAARLVVGLGTANRNIALAVLVAVASFPGTPVVPAVVANGLLLILLGLLHVGGWRLHHPKLLTAAAPSAPSGQCPQSPPRPVRETGASG
jgi:BASS family bile acid:Na+ symporter